MRGDHSKDLQIMYEKVTNYFGKNVNIEDIYKKLLGLSKVGILNINHSILELILSGFLINRGFRVYVEVEVSGGVIDIYAIKGTDIGIEVETGYVPPINAINPEEFLMSRLALKISRYSNIANEFYIAVPSFYLPPIPKELLKDPNERSEDEIRNLMRLIRKYSKTPDITLNDVKNSKINGIITINSKVMKINIIDNKSFYNLKQFYDGI
ncbi:hypothetical protein [Sulfurisphaera tokodaii]|uniref:Uncharacterized protein n=2 Tax=Sulfurisphaera tokodaii TaxID=111955 RepID=F9VPD4_SULTO|nr:hypothetical protein [Sulfurisphaera tokodaii]BAK54781.1 hypothetical protein STK_23110 [Sulfurisphaera tokodaii str. 7]